ncbi:MAG TPA: hypothetical protein VKX25_17490 [Bryobacteraceae bacterium]|jgi:hypothetical protein|nr:hypothetical protein [Bryobacteraceae bacterium]
MTLSFVRFYSAQRLLPMCTLISLSAVFAASAHGQIEDEVSAATSNPARALFEYAAVSGSGGTVTATRVPVYDSKGTLSYQDVSIQFTIDPTSGKLKLASYTVNASPNLLVASFKAGTYGGPSTIYNGTMLVNLSGPGVATGGATVWALQAATGADACTFPDSAYWYVGALPDPVLAARIQKAGIATSGWSFGIGGSGCETSTNNAAWYPNSLIGARQSGNDLILASFTDGYGKDHNTTQDEITYHLTPKQ